LNNEIKSNLLQIYEFDKKKSVNTCKLILTNHKKLTLLFKNLAINLRFLPAIKKFQPGLLSFLPNPEPGKLQKKA